MHPKLSKLQMMLPEQNDSAQIKYVPLNSALFVSRSGNVQLYGLRQVLCCFSWHHVFFSFSLICLVYMPVMFFTLEEGKKKKKKVVVYERYIKITLLLLLTTVFVFHSYWTQEPRDDLSSFPSQRAAAEKSVRWIGACCWYDRHASNGVFLIVLLRVNSWGGCWSVGMYNEGIPLCRTVGVWARG